MPTMQFRKAKGLAALTLAAALALAPLTPARAAATPGATRVADTDTYNSYRQVLGNQDSTLEDGCVWVDKTVTTGPSPSPATPAASWWTTTPISL